LAVFTVMISFLISLFLCSDLTAANAREEAKHLALLETHPTTNFAGPRRGGRRSYLPANFCRTYLSIIFISSTLPSQSTQHVES
jgi:hypothetical protein